MCRSAPQGGADAAEPPGLFGLGASFGPGRILGAGRAFGLDLVDQPLDAVLLLDRTVEPEIQFGHPPQAQPAGQSAGAGRAVARVSALAVSLRAPRRSIVV